MICTFVLASLSLFPIAGAEPEALAPGVRGLAVAAEKPVVIDGRLGDWSGAFVTPVHYNHGDLLNRAAQFLYLWDKDALYIGLRALDRKRANIGNERDVWNGDAVEFYLDTRSGSNLRGKDWSDGAIHLFFSPFEGNEVKPRWVIRPGIATSNTVLKGVEIAATAEDWGYEVEFKIPWANFPNFEARAGALIALDAELCSGDGGGRTDRTFAYGSPLSVQQPASLGLVELVRSFDPSYGKAVGPATFPMWVDTPWTQTDRAEVRATIAIPPKFLDRIDSVDVRLHDADGQIVKTLPARVERFGPNGLGFARALASWSIDDYAPNTYFATARIRDRDGQVLATVAPRMNQEAQMSGR